MCVWYEPLVYRRMDIFLLTQVGLASIKQRMIQEIGRYGLNPKFTEVEAESIKKTSQEIQKRYISALLNFLTSLFIVIVYLIT